MQQANLIEVFGQSHNTGYATAGQEYAWPAIVASALGAYEANYSANGLSFAAHINGYQKYLRPALALRARQAAPYVSPVDAVIINGGLSDLASNMANGGVITPGAYRAALDAILAFAQLAAYYKAEPSGASHASITYGGTWYDGTNTDRNTGAGYRSTFTVGSTLTIAVPPDFPGGDIVLLWLIPGSGNGVTWRIIAVGQGGRYGAIEKIGAQDADQVTTTQWGLKATRLKGLAPGAYTITATLTAVDAFGVAFDGWGIQAVNPPALAVVRQPRLTPANYAAWLGPAAGDTPTDDTVAILNRNASEVAEAAGASWIENIDTTVFLDPSRWTADGAHPNEAGHVRIAAQILKHLQTVDRSIQAPVFPLLPAAFAANWGNDTTPYAGLTYTPRRARLVRLSGRAKRTGTPSTGETIATLPEGLRPASTASFVCPGSTGTPTVTIDSTGAIKYAAGSLGASGTIDLDGIEITAKAIS